VQHAAPVSSSLPWPPIHPSKDAPILLYPQLVSSILVFLRPVMHPCGRRSPILFSVFPWLDLPNNIWWVVQVMRLTKLQRHLGGEFRDTLWNWTTIASLHKILNSLFKNHLVIRWYKLWLIKGVIE
jgi:hypothetical protein